VNDHESSIDIRIAGGSSRHVGGGAIVTVAGFAALQDVPRRRHTAIAPIRVLNVVGTSEAPAHW
jgi:hypothetical protein